jgi:hypothetical protein
MGSDGLVDLDQETWTVLAKYNLALTTLFGVVTLWAQTAPPANPLDVLVVENGLLALLFGAMQTYAWLSN